MQLSDLGFSGPLEAWRVEQAVKPGEVWRVMAVHRERYLLAGSTGEGGAVLSGHFRFADSQPGQYPVVGDWVIAEASPGGPMVIRGLFPRRGVVRRRAAGTSSESQILAAHVDYALLVQALDADFSLNRLERYIALCADGGVNPVIVLTKADLMDHGTLAERTHDLTRRLPFIRLCVISNRTRNGYPELEGILEKAKTFCLLGSSGVGKSTLVNALTGEDQMRTGPVSLSTGKGCHVTTHREAIVLANGAILIDNPGMREVGLTDLDRSPEPWSRTIRDLAPQCRFVDCSHQNEPGCAVLKALASNELDPEVYSNFLRMRRESEFFEADQAERRKKDRDFGKMIKNFKKKHPPKGF